MQKQFPNTAIFILTRDATSEARAKSLTNRGLPVNREIIRQMNRETTRIASSIGLPVFHVDGELGPGESFGIKLEKAFERVFNAGYKKVIAIGNDCPGLSKRRLWKAAVQLQHNKIVVGPAKDGGVYLIGFQKIAFSGAGLHQLPWLTDRLFIEMKIAWSEFGISTLPAEHDLDELADMRRVLGAGKANAYIRAIRAVLNPAPSRPMHPFFRYPGSFHDHQVQLRGPPIPF